MSMVFLADPRPHLEDGEWEQGKCVLSLQKVIPRPTGGTDSQTDSQTEGERLEGERVKDKKKSYTIPDGSWVM